MSAIVKSVLGNFQFSTSKKNKKGFKKRSFKRLEDVPNEVWENKRLFSITAFLTTDVSEEEKKQYVNLMKKISNGLQWKGTLQVTPFTENDGGTSMYIAKKDKVIPDTIDESVAFVASLFGSASK